MTLAWREHDAARLADADLAQAWDRLNAQRRDLPFLSAQAVGCALRAFGNGGERLLVATTGGAAAAMLVVVRDGPLRWRTFQPAQLPLGAFVCARDLPLAALAASLGRGPLRFALALSLTQIDPWLAPRDSDAARCTTSDYVPTAWVELEGSFDDYWARRGKNLRQNLRKQRTRLADDGVLPHTTAWTAAADMAAAVERYGTLESAGWKGAEGTAVHAANVQGRFYRELLEGAAAAGEAVAYEHRFGERTVAMNLCLRRGSTLVVLKTSYDESLQAVSPAFLLHQDMLQALFGESRVRRVEYYGRVMEWHTRWTDQQRVLYHQTFFRWPVVRRLAAWRARQGRAKAAPPATAPA
jgi:CelD/BcsL family acetyltransferase involved in cellulose biosynthesis